MSYLMKKAQGVFKGTPLFIEEFCSIDSCKCRHHHEECNQRVMGVYSQVKSRLIGYFVGDRLEKTNPKPSKRYIKRVLGVSKEKKRKFRRKFITRSPK